MQLFQRDAMQQAVQSGGKMWVRCVHNDHIISLDSRSSVEAVVINLENAYAASTFQCKCVLHNIMHLIR